MAWLPITLLALHGTLAFFLYQALKEKQWKS
ncbi:hypothetical protein HNQ92_005269 [Rhabdobacter roseus]|uniref:Uncharacterized protein n=1 Tax=Rhabdobacter roseus TaxID=1655419 RepID=A0A840U001_9BACT|nr:hypothetical protein [Rhabdobacter roseus]